MALETILCVIQQKYDSVTTSSYNNLMQLEPTLISSAGCEHTDCVRLCVMLCFVGDRLAGIPPHSFSF